MTKLPALTETNITTNKHIDIKDLINYAERGLSYREIGTLAGCTHANVAQRFRQIGYVPETAKRFRRDKNDLLHIVANGYWDEIVLRISEGKLKDESFQQLVVQFGIIIDKILALEGKGAGSLGGANIQFTFNSESVPTANTVSLDNTK